MGTELCASGRLSREAGVAALVGDGDAEQVEEDDLDAWLDDMIA